MTSDRYENGLAATGIGYNDIDFVMCTHLHVDHIGWNTRLENGRWVPTLPKAKYLFGKQELVFGRERSGPILDPNLGSSTPSCQSLRRSAMKRSTAIMD